MNIQFATREDEIAYEAEVLFCDGSPIMYRALMAIANCTADEITRAVKAGKLQLVRNVSGRGLDMFRIRPLFNSVHTLGE